MADDLMPSELLAASRLLASRGRLEVRGVSNLVLGHVDCLTADALVRDGSAVRERDEEGEWVRPVAPARRAS